MGENSNHSGVSSMIAQRMASTASSTLVSSLMDRLSNRNKTENTTIHLDQYSPDAASLVKMAQTLADERKHSLVEPLHLLACITEQPEMAPVFQKINVNMEALNAATQEVLNGLPKSNSNGLAYLSSAMLAVLKFAEEESDKHVGLDNLLNALCREIKGKTGQVLQQFNIAPGAFRPHAAMMKHIILKSTNIMGTGYARDLVACARSGQFGPTIGRDIEIRRLLQILSRSSKNSPLLIGEPGVGKTAIIRGIAQRMANEEVPPNLSQTSYVEIEINALLAGTKVRSEIEERIKKTINDFRRDDKKVILVLEGIDSLIGQSPLTNVIDTFKTLLMREEVIIFGTTTPEGLRKINDKDPNLVRKFSVMNVEEPTPEQAVEILRGISNRFEEHHKVQISDQAIQSAVQLAKRYVQDKFLPDSAIDLLDEASASKRVEMTGVPADLDRDIQRLVSLKAQQSKLLNSPDPSGARVLDKINQEILELEPKISSARSKIERRRKIGYTREMVQEELVKAQKEMEEAQASSNFARLGELEHKIIPDLHAKMEKVEEFYQANEPVVANNVVGEQDIAAVIGEWTGIPVTKMLEDETAKLLKMEERISRRVIGQDPAVKALAKAVKRARIGLRDPRKPIGSFLFLGPSGVGKTEVSKALAEFLFDDEQAITRIDCSEFMEKHQCARLIGAPVGYQGSEEGGELVNAVRKRPYSVVLFDEVEKAHPDVFNLLLQVLDEGTLSSSRGEVGNFSNTVVVLTSNLGSRRILEADPNIFETEEGREAMKDILRDEVAKFLRPEFINRIDDILTFQALSKQNLRGIVDLELRRVEKLLVERELKLDLSEAAKIALVEMSYDPPMGARPLKRSILKKIQDQLTDVILTNGYKQGATISVDYNDKGEFVFT